MSNVLITGTSSGIGQATAMHLARRGHRVFATLRDISRGKEMRETAAREQLPLQILPLNVDSDESVAAAVAQVLEMAGRLDVLVNNAGIEHLGSVERTPLARVRQIFETNVFGAIRTIQAVLPGMRAQGGGRIINVSSVAGHFAIPMQAHYAATKHALGAISEALAAEVRHFGIRVSLIEPGIIRTSILDNITTSGDADPGSPYAGLAARTAGVFATARDADPPVVVAAVIEQAMSVAEPKFRYAVGATAQPLLDGRKRITDEQWIELGGTVADEDWARAWKGYFR